MIVRIFQYLYTNLASGSSKVSRFSQRVAMMDSYLFGYLRKMSLMTTMAS